MQNYGIHIFGVDGIRTGDLSIMTILHRNHYTRALPLAVFNLELALWSRGRVVGSQPEGPRFDPHVSLKRFTKS